MILSPHREVFKERQLSAFSLEFIWHFSTNLTGAAIECKKRRPFGQATRQ
jgi:hypothetical protein